MKRRKRVKNGSPRRDLEKRARQIVRRGIILDLGSNVFRVSSQSQKHRYCEVRFPGDWSCDCAYHAMRHADCKHIMAVQLLVMSVPDIAPTGLELKRPAVRCASKECGPANCTHCQTRPRRFGGASHRYGCADCGKRFTFRPGFLGRRYPSGAITDVLEDVAAGKSLAGAARGVGKRSCAGTKRTPARSSAGRWAEDANAMTARIYGNIPMPVSGRWTVDETYVRTLGGDRYLFGVMDSGSRFVTACDMSDTKLDCDATDLFRKAVGAAGKIPRVLVSDRLHGFGRGFKNVMAGGRRGQRERSRPPCHVRSASIRGRHVNNNRRERLNGVIKDRIKTVRGFNSENPALLGLLVTYYNFLRPHAGLDGKTPAEKLGILVRGPDKWATLLACAAAYC